MQAILNTNEQQYFGFYNQILEKDFYLENICKFSSDYIVILNTRKQVIICSESFNRLFKNESVSDKNFIKLMNKISDFPEDFFCEKQYFIKIKQGKKIKIFLANICQNQVHSINEKKYIVIFKDITEENETELQKNTFISTIKHDLKTPVRANNLALEFLLKAYDKKIPNEQIKIIKEVLRSNNFIFNMLDTLLLKFQYEGNLKLDKSFIDFNQFMLEIINEFELLFKENNIVLNLYLLDKNTNFHADKLKLKIALSNIISNAIKFNMPKGYVTIHIFIEADKIIIKIQNSGIGISKDKINYIFDKYTSSAMCYRKLGTGQSLYISKKIIEAHNGSVQVKSLLNTNTTFLISLPINNT